MRKNTLLKYKFFSAGNIKRLILVNLLVFLPLLAFFYSAIKLVPLLIRYIDTLNISVLEADPSYTKLALIVVSKGQGEGFTQFDRVYVFKKSDFNSIRKFVFLSSLDKSSIDVLEEKSLAYSDIREIYNPITLTDPSGRDVVTFKIEDISDGNVEILFFNTKAPRKGRPFFINLTLLIVSFFLITGSIGGISDYTQRVVFHEPKRFRYLFRAIKNNFFQSVIISCLIFIVIGAVTANIYFYIFVLSTDISVIIAAINFWMLIFFLFILLWVFPLYVLSNEDTVWRIIKKSLFLSFDNFEFTLAALFYFFVLILSSIFTLFILPGPAGTLSFLNTALKEISSRYRNPEIDPLSIKKL
jgi:hypothetical protein